jgi:histidine triad (HIT) family protein
MNCILCKIANKKSPAYIIYEDDIFIAFLDKYPKTWGHTQLIPKTHYRWVWDEPFIDQHFAVANQIIQHYKKVLNIDTCYLTVWGNQIPHAHIQILPKYKPLTAPQELDESAAKLIQQQLQYKPC